MAKPSKKLPSRAVTICCASCKSKLLRYRKGGSGALVKCFLSRITNDYTLNEGTCPNCKQLFARKTLIRGEPALKIIGGKVLAK